MAELLRAGQQLGSRSTKAGAENEPTYGEADPLLGLFWFSYFAAFVGLIVWAVA